MTLGDALCVSYFSHPFTKYLKKKRCEGGHVSFGSQLLVKEAWQWDQLLSLAVRVCRRASSHLCGTGRQQGSVAKKELNHPHKASHQKPTFSIQVLKPLGLWGTVYIQTVTPFKVISLGGWRDGAAVYI